MEIENYESLLRTDVPLAEREELIGSLFVEEVLQNQFLKLKLFLKLCNYGLFERAIDLCKTEKINLRKILVSLQDLEFIEPEDNEICFFSTVFVCKQKNDFSVLFDPTFDSFQGLEFRSFEFENQLKLVKILKRKLIKEEGVTIVQRRWRFIRNMLFSYVSDERLKLLVLPFLELELLPRNFIPFLIEKTLDVRKSKNEEIFSLVISNFKDQFNIFFNDSSIIFKVSINGLCKIAEFYSGEILSRIMRLRPIESLVVDGNYLPLVPLIEAGWIVKKKELIESLKLGKTEILKIIFENLKRSISDNEIEYFVQKYSKDFGTIKSYTFSTLIYISQQFEELTIENGEGVAEPISQIIGTFPYDTSTLLYDLETGDIETMVEIVEELMTGVSPISQTFFRLNCISKRSFILNVKVVILKLIDKYPDDMKYRVCFDRVSPYIFDDLPLLNPERETDDKKTSDPDLLIEGDTESESSERRSRGFSIRIVDDD